MLILYPKSAQFPVGAVAGASMILGGGFLFQGALVMAAGALAVMLAAAGVSVWLTTREG